MEASMRTPLKIARVSAIRGVFVAIARRLPLYGALLAAIYGSGLGADSAAGTLQTCTVQNNSGQPVSGTVCGGTTHGGNCTPGVLYKCNTNTTTNNCTLNTT